MKDRAQHLIDFIMFLAGHGFPHLALEHIKDLHGSGSAPEDVLFCTEGIVMLENMGRGVQALKCFENALELNPSYPQAARLAFMHALTSQDALRYGGVFLDSMQQHLKKPGFFARLSGPKRDSFMRYSNLCQTLYSAGRDDVLRNLDDIQAYHYAQCLALWDKMPAKELSVGSILTEIVKLGNPGKTQVTGDMLRDRIRNCIELCIKANMELQSKQREYMQSPVPSDNFFAQDAITYADYYLEEYDPYDIVVLNWKASEFRELELYQECIDVCDTAIALQPDGYYYHYTNKALSLIALERYAEAEKLYPAIEREATAKDPKILSVIKECLSDKKVLPGSLTMDNLRQYFRSFIEGASYAARKELTECERTGRITILKDFLTRFSLFNEADKPRELADLLRFFTPACVYEYISTNMSCNNYELLDLLLDTFGMIGYGIVDEMLAELCWLFAISPRNYGFFAPLRVQLAKSLAWTQVDAGKTALQRLLPPLYEYVCNSDKWGAQSFHSISYDEMSREQRQRYI